MKKVMVSLSLLLVLFNYYKVHSKIHYSKLKSLYLILLVIFNVMVYHWLLLLAKTVKILMVLFIKLVYVSHLKCLNLQLLIILILLLLHWLTSRLFKLSLKNNDFFSLHLYITATEGFKVDVNNHAIFVSTPSGSPAGSIDFEDDAP